MKEIPLSQSKVTLVDDEDYEWLNQWKWCAWKSGNIFYAERSVYPNGWKGKKITILMHREILCLANGDGKLGDHRDRNGLNNQKHNLRVVNKAINGYNRKMMSNNKSGYRGVSFYKPNNKWATKIRVETVLIHCGYHPEKIDAARAYDQAALKYYGNDAILNFPEERI